jgi:hypothetical protein
MRLQLTGLPTTSSLNPFSQLCGSCSKPAETANGVAANDGNMRLVSFKFRQTSPLPFPSPLGSFLNENAMVKIKILPRRREMIN